MNIPLPPELEKLVERLVKSGRYSSAGDVVREALRLLDEREKVRKLQLSAMRKEIAKGVREARRGDHYDGDRVFERLEAYATRAVRKKRA
jgi:antitoxin ParD1/3/4